jgi:hypothetical protein
MVLILQIALGTCLGMLASNLSLALYITIRQRKVAKTAADIAAEFDFSEWAEREDAS